MPKNLAHRQKGEQVSTLFSDLPSFSVRKIMNELPRAKRQRDLSTMEDFYRVAKDVQRRTGQKMAADVTEDRRFREYFGAGVAVAINAWTLLTELDLLPDGAEICHLLWAMYFLKCYPRTEEGCSAAASKKGAVDLKTWRKHTWPVIYALSDLESAMVSSCIVLFTLKSCF